MSQAKVDSNHRPSPCVQGCSTIELSARDEKLLGLPNPDTFQTPVYHDTYCEFTA